MLSDCGEVRHTPLFATVHSERAGELADFLAARGILVRSFPDQPLLRCGLPATEADWQRLATALAAWRAA